MNVQFVLARQYPRISLQEAIDSALQNNHILQIRSLQIKGKKAEVNEAEIKKYPTLMLNSNYQYDVNVPQLTIPAGSFGTIPISPAAGLPLPNNKASYELGKNNIFGAGLSLYQPLTQLKKINTSIEINKTNVRISEKEKLRDFMQIAQSVEKLYYAILIAQKQQEEATAKLELAKLRLYDVESALLSGKTITLNKAGLQANIADEELNIMKLTIQEDDYWTDFKGITGIAGNYNLEEVAVTNDLKNSLEEYKSAAESKNIDNQIAGINKSKAEMAIRIAKQGNLPDVGLISGYIYQTGNDLLPKNNYFVGMNLKWNFQDVFSTHAILTQRKLLLQQAEENTALTKEKINNEVEKTYRKATQVLALIEVAKKALAYRKEELKVQQDKEIAGLNNRADILNAQSLVAKAAADLYSAQLAFRLTISELKSISGL